MRKVKQKIKIKKKMTKKRFKNWKRPLIKDGKLTKWSWMVQYPKNLTLNRNVDIGAFCYINALNKVVIERDVQIGSHCAIYSVSTIDGKGGKVVLKENCRLGSHSTVMPGVTIGKNSIVGAHSFVNKNIPDNVIAVGCPAKVIRKI